MNPAPELAPQLKSLRLSGILGSLEARNRQAIESKLAYTGCVGRSFERPRNSISLTLIDCPNSTERWSMT